jgi:diguanylate cyclase (GGDEF)-like protein
LSTRIARCNSAFMSTPHPTGHLSHLRRATKSFWRFMHHLALVAGSIHAGFIVLFAILGAPSMAWLNVGSVLIFSLASWCLRTRRNLLGASLIVAEVMLHAAVAVRAIGWDSGFHYYLLVGAPVIFISRARSLQARMCLLLGLMGSYLALDLSMHRIEPWDVLSPQVLEAMRSLNILTTIGLLAYLSSLYDRLVAQAEKQLTHLATTDPLTDLHNRRSMTDLAAYEIVQRKRHGEPLSVVLADVDHFKQINDRHGHEVGDAVLAAISQALRDTVREQDSIGRWGGEEFLLLLPQASAMQASMVAERLRTQLQRMNVSADGKPIHITMTMGVSEHQPNEPLDTLIRRADEALYRGKAKGRDQVVLAPG